MYKILVILIARDIIEASCVPHGAITGRSVHSEVIEFESFVAAEDAHSELMKTCTLDGVGINQVIRLYKRK